jgi:hypothetical protein
MSNLVQRGYDKLRELEELAGNATEDDKGAQDRSSLPLTDLSNGYIFGVHYSWYLRILLIAALVILLYKCLTKPKEASGTTT